MNDDNFKYKKFFDIFMIILVSLSVFILIYDIKHDVNRLLELFDVYVITFIFAIEYLIRLWVYSDIHSQILQEYEIATFLEKDLDLKKLFKEILLKKWEYIKSPFAIIDLLAILPGYRPLRFLRIFVIFRLFKILRYTKSVNTFLEVLANKKFELFILLLAVGFVTFIGGAIIYIFEAHQNPKIETFFDAIYWSLITISTVGYGDITPTTKEGKTLTMILILIGIGFISFATSIIASAFTEKLEELKSDRIFRIIKHMNNLNLLCGFSNETEVLAEKFKKENINFIIIDVNEEKIKKALSLGYLAIKGDITNKNFLQMFDFNQIEKIFILTNNDITNAFMILSIKAFSKNTPIISLVSNEENSNKIKKAGADYVIIPSNATAILVSEYIGNPITFEVIDAILTEKKNAIIDEIIVIKDSILDGKLIGEIDFDKYKIILFGVLKRKESPLLNETFNLSQGHFYFNPPFDLKLEDGDIMVVMGYKVSINYFKYQIEKSSL